MRLGCFTFWKSLSSSHRSSPSFDKCDYYYTRPLIDMESMKETRILHLDLASRMFHKYTLNFLWNNNCYQVYLNHITLKFNLVENGLPLVLNENN